MFNDHDGWYVQKSNILERQLKSARILAFINSLTFIYFDVDMSLLSVTLAHSNQNTTTTTTTLSP